MSIGRHRSLATRSSHLVTNSVAQLIVGITITAAMFAACGADAPDAANTPTGPVTPGAAAYAANCASCHGPMLDGTLNGPPLLSQVYEPSHHPDESFRSAVTNGVQAHHWNFGPMPAIGLDDDTITAIIEHVRATQTAEGFQPYPPAP